MIIANWKCNGSKLMINEWFESYKNMVKNNGVGAGILGIAPPALFINDVNIEALAVAEAIKLKIPIVAIVDTNSDPTGITFPIPGNDDARRAINLYCDLIKQTILDAQKNIAVRVEEEPKSEQTNENSNNEKNFKSKPNDKKKKPTTVIKTSPAKSKEKKISLFSKIKSLASTKKK